MITAFTPWLLRRISCADKASLPQSEEVTQWWGKLECLEQRFAGFV